MSAPPSFVEDDLPPFSDPPPPFTETDANAPGSAQSQTRPSITFTLTTHSPIDTPISTSDPHHSPSYLIPSPLDSTSSSVKLYRVSPNTSWRDSDAVFTLYRKNPVYPTSLITSPSLRASIKESVVGRNIGKSVIAEPSGLAILDISLIGGIISECSQEQRAVARMFDYKTADEEKVLALEVYDAERLRKDRLDLVVAVWVSLVWNEAHKRGHGARIGRRIMGKIWGPKEV